MRWMHELDGIDEESASEEVVSLEDKSSSVAEEDEEFKITLNQMKLKELETIEEEENDR